MEERKVEERKVEERKVEERKVEGEYVKIHTNNLKQPEDNSNGIFNGIQTYINKNFDTLSQGKGKSIKPQSNNNDNPYIIVYKTLTKKEEKRDKNLEEMIKNENEKLKRSVFKTSNTHKQKPKTYYTSRYYKPLSGNDYSHNLY